MPDAPSAALDRQRLQEALALAESVIGLTDPNPRVGCVIGLPDGTVLGRGATQEAGAAHAEVMALRDAQAAGLAVRDATAWATLEPCAHHGRTPPCCDALIAAGIARVVIAVSDPFPHVNGGGIARLRAAGIAVDMAGTDIAAAAREMNIGFFSRIERGLPWVRLKIAASLDGRTALPNGRSQWITGMDARRDGHAWRRRAGAVLTGIGTALADDPRLNVRLVPTARQPMRVLVDSALRLPLAAQLLKPPGKLLIYHAGSLAGTDETSRGNWTQRHAGLLDAGAELVALPSGQQPQRVDLRAMLQHLAQRGVNELHVEAGAQLNGALLRAGLADELLVYMAPRLLGAGRPMSDIGPFDELAQAPELHVLEAGCCGSDLRVRLRQRQNSMTDELGA